MAEKEGVKCHGSKSPVSGPNVQALAPSILSFDSSDSAIEVSKAVGPSKD